MIEIVRSFKSPRGEGLLHGSGRGGPGQNCFKSLSAQTFRALFAHSLIQIVTTFHGGMEAIGYEWGTEDKLGTPKDKSPDHNSHHQKFVYVSSTML